MNPRPPAAQPTAYQPPDVPAYGPAPAAPAAAPVPGQPGPPAARPPAGPGAAKVAPALPPVPVAAGPWIIGVTLLVIIVVAVGVGALGPVIGTTPALMVMAAALFGVFAVVAFFRFRRKKAARRAASPSGNRPPGPRNSPFGNAPTRDRKGLLSGLFNRTPGPGGGGKTGLFGGLFNRKAGPAGKVSPFGSTPGGKPSSAPGSKPGGLGSLFKRKPGPGGAPAGGPSGRPGLLGGQPGRRPGPGPGSPGSRPGPGPNSKPSSPGSRSSKRSGLFDFLKNVGSKTVSTPGPGNTKKPLAPTSPSPRPGARPGPGAGPRPSPGPRPGPGAGSRPATGPSAGPRPSPGPKPAPPQPAAPAGPPTPAPSGNAPQGEPKVTEPEISRRRGRHSVQGFAADQKHEAHAHLEASEAVRRLADQGDQQQIIGPAPTDSMRQVAALLAVAGETSGTSWKLYTQLQKDDDDRDRAPAKGSDRVQQSADVERNAGEGGLL